MAAVLSRFDGSLYNSALTKFIYLLDIEAVFRNSKQVSAIKWRRDNHGPFVWDILNCAREDKSLFTILPEAADKRRIVLLDKGYIPHVDNEVIGILEEVIAKTPNPKTHFIDFVDYVYQTPPMLLSRKNGPLDIHGAMEAAREVNEVSDVLLNTAEWDEALRYLAAN